MALINAHEHLQSMDQLPLILRAMDRSEIERVVILGSSAFTITSDYRLGFTQYDENNQEIIKAAGRHADRIEAWPTLDPCDPNKFEKLRHYYEIGASGLKLYLGHGFVAPGSGDYLFSRVAMDDPRMDEVYAYCSAHRLPVCRHVNPTRPGFADEFVVLLERYPQLLVNAPHWILSVGRRERLVELLEVFPNMVTDISFGVDDFLIAGLRRISRTSLRLRRVVERHPDRFIFGTDLVVTSAPHKTSEWIHLRVQAYLSMLSCKQYETPLIPSEVLNGLNLPAKVLEQIRSRNYLAFRSPDRQLRVPTRPVDWSRMGVPHSTRSPGQRIRYEAVSETSRLHSTSTGW